MKVLKSPAKGAKRTGAQWRAAFRSVKDSRERPQCETERRQCRTWDPKTATCSRATCPKHTRRGKSEALLGAFHNAKIKPGVYVNGSIMGANEYAEIRRPWQAKLADYCVRQGEGDGKWGIYLRAYNVRVAAFADNSLALREALTQAFDAAHELKQAATKTFKAKRAVRDAEDEQRKVYRRKR